MKYSKQRESILKYLRSTKCHPTAETVYQNILSENPNISLGTVYRNLTLLTELGDISKSPTLKALTALTETMPRTTISYAENAVQYLI